ncbi:hypothetical protein [Mycolicibacterium gadium]|uniref:Cellulose synthase n=1 Tax=Mycolicibacterium gadium TaxID=1794 RepID=A0A7I7WS04_MYCGU|nr:hypothetical protein [Mycolicibacterium gadium]BBZ20466.1 hypothetical protein MGAD_48010 [Mycolicibacterium gadium]
MRAIARALIVPLAVIGVAAQAMLPTSPVASAQPYETAAAEPNVTPAISLRQLGLPDKLEIIGSNQAFDTSIPVPEGIGPSMLTGQIGSVVNVIDGRVDVLDARGIVLGSIVVPMGVSAVPFTVDISGAMVNEGRAPLSFILRDQNPPSTSCTELPSLSLSQLMTTFSGPTPDPTTVAGFLPRYLDQITIGVGPNPSRDQQQAALALVAKLTQLSRPIPVRIDVDTSSSPVWRSGGPTRRSIEIRESDNPGIAVENPGTQGAVLAITGKGEELLRQVDLFADRRYELAQTTTASVNSMKNSVPTAAYTRSFGELDMTAESEILGVETLYIGFDASEFAVGSIDHAQVHLISNYTPVTSGNASILIRSGSTVLATHKLDESGLVDLYFDLPPETIASNVGLSLEIRYNPERDCAPLTDRITFAVDPRSTVTVTPGSHNRGGFPVLPMAFAPEFDVAIDQPEHIRYAAQAINLMGQHSVVALRPRLATLDEAAGRGSGLVVVASGEELARAGMQPPMLTTGATVVDVNGAPITDIDIHGPLGVVQAFSHNGRMVLALNSTGDWGLVDRSFDYIRGLENRWASLIGDTVATGPAGDTANMAVRAGDAMTPQPDLANGWRWWVWATIAAGVIAVLAAISIVVLRKRRANP